MTQTFYENLPAVPLRGLVVLPGEFLNFDAGREKSIRALQEAFDANGLVFLSSQIDAYKNDVAPEDIFAIGSLCRVRQIVRLPGDSMRVLVEGICRAKTMRYSATDPYYMVDALCMEAAEPDEMLAEALRRRLSKQVAEFAHLSGKLNSDAINSIERVSGHGAYADAAANPIIQKTEERQRILEETDPLKRMELVLDLVSREIEVLRIDRRIAQEVKRRIDKNQKEYYLREQIRVIRDELGEGKNSDADEYRSRMSEKKLPDIVREKLEKEIDRLGDLPAGSHEEPMERAYIECLLDLPWLEMSEDNLDIENAKAILDREHYGLQKVKDRILEYLAVSKLTGGAKGQILCLIGPPGVGKTSIAHSVAEAIGRKFVRMSLGGIKDEAEIRGHRRTYIGAMPGRIIAAMRQAGTMNPVLLFDEVDKLGSDHWGDPSSAMLEVVDSAQNYAFRDHFLELPYDLSNVMFIMTANNYEGIPRPLLDRMEVIDVQSYLETEKMEIAKRHLLPKQMKKHGLKKSSFHIPDELIGEVIRHYTSEAGVRNLERTLAAICRKAACEIAGGRARVALSHKKLVSYLGQPIHRKDQVELTPMVGVVNGLAWTPVGGAVLTVEAQVIDGTGQLQLTGHLGDVMQESAKAALTFIRAHAGSLGLDPLQVQKKDIHVHVPEGSVPKDGPSAGITIATAIASALTGASVKPHVAMTGEITLRGRILPIGGLREKLLAAVRAGIKTVLLPQDNRADLEEVPQEVLCALKIRYVQDIRDVLAEVLLDLPAQQAKRSAAIAPHLLRQERIGVVQ